MVIDAHLSALNVLESYFMEIANKSAEELMSVIISVRMSAMRIVHLVIINAKLSVLILLVLKNVENLVNHALRIAKSVVNIQSAQRNALNLAIESHVKSHARRS